MGKSPDQMKKIFYKRVVYSSLSYDVQTRIRKFAAEAARGRRVE